MANVPKSTIRGEVLALIGDTNRITNATLDIIMEAENRVILDSYDWSRSTQDATLVTNTSISVADSATVNDGSTLITATNAAATWINRFLRVGTEDNIYQVTSVNVGTNATIESAYIGDDDANAALTLIQLFYSTGGEYVTDVVNNADGPLEERTREWLDREDPARKTTATRPTVWAAADVDVNTDLALIELWPVATDQTLLRVEYIEAATIANDTDVTVYPPALLVYRSAWFAAQYVAANINDNTQVWLQLAQSHRVAYEREFKRAVLNDLPNSRKYRSIRSRLRDRDRNADRRAFVRR